MTLLNGHTTHGGYDYFTFKHDDNERIKIMNPLPKCLNALHDLAMEKHLVQMGLNPIIEHLPYGLDLVRVCRLTKD